MDQNEYPIPDRIPEIPQERDDLLFSRVARINYQCRQMDKARNGSPSNIYLAIRRTEEWMKEYDRLHHADRKGDWMPTYTGRRFWPEDPRPTDINIEDIAYGLANINRFNGYTGQYNVGQHSCLVAFRVIDELKMLALFHDSPEAYLQDIISPNKKLFHPFYTDAESKVMDAIAQKFDFAITDEAKRLVKAADLNILACEIRDLLPCGYVNTKNPPIPADVNTKLDPKLIWTPTISEMNFKAFYEEFEELPRVRYASPTEERRKSVSVRETEELQPGMRCEGEREKPRWLGKVSLAFRRGMDCLRAISGRKHVREDSEERPS